MLAAKLKHAPSENSQGNRTQVLAAWVLLLAIVLVLAACEYPGVPHPMAAAQAKVNSPLPADGNMAQPSSSGGVEQKAETLEGTVPIALQDFRLEPDHLTIKAGGITFVLKNEGRYTHDFRVEGQGIDEKAPKVGQGRTFEWKITLQPGSYQISCPISNHADRGMNGTLEVMP